MTCKPGTSNYLNAQMVCCAAADDTWIVVASDGLFENDVRGGGGGLENQEVVDYLLKSQKGASAEELSQRLIRAAQEQGTTDDVTVVCMKLSL